MAYIGNAPADRFTSIPTVQQFNGDGSTTAFTLSRPVGTDQDLLVSVDGVIQDTAAYAVSNGTTLTFSAAPSTGTANIFVNYLGVTIGSVVHPASSALAATTGTFTDNVTTTGEIGIGVAPETWSSNYPALQIGQVTTLTGHISSIQTQLGHNWYIGTGNQYVVDGAAARLLISSDSSIKFSQAGSGSADGSISATDTFLIDANGHVTMPKTSAFLARPASSQENISTGGVTIAFGTEIFDQNADFASNTFTAPVTGRYLLAACIRLDAVDSASSRYELKIETSNRNYNYNFDPDFGQDAATWTTAWSVLADMDASDTAIVTINQTAGTAQTDIHTDSTFSGYLAC